MPPARPYQVTMHQAWPPSTRHEASVMSQEGPPTQDSVMAPAVLGQLPAC